MTARGQTQRWIRRIVKALLKALGITVISVGWAALATRRQFNLPRWTRGRQFVDLHDTIVSWLDCHLELTEQGAPWLHPVGTDKYDYCQSFAVSRLVRFVPLVRNLNSTAKVTCRREVIAVYGFDGDLTQRLDQLANALLGAGWRKAQPWKPRKETDADGWALIWQPSDALGRAPGMEETPPWGEQRISLQHMHLSWSSRGQGTGLEDDPTRTRSNTRRFLMVERSGTEYWKLPQVALEQHEHMVALHLTLFYYMNSNARARPHRIPRYLLPTLSLPGRSR